VKPAPTSATVDTLVRIWQRVLQLPSVGIDDNFFDLGGDSALALELFNEIALASGRELPPVMIYQAPTIAALASLLEQPVEPSVPALVQLKSGSEPPLFIAHGLGGSVIDFYQVVKYMDTPLAIYGMQAKGIDGVEESLDRIEDMARYSLDAIRQLQPHGPYLLAGFSLGGLVTLEMAQQLIAEGEKVGLLAMLDTYPHMSRLSGAQRARMSARQTWRRLARRLTWLGVRPPYETTVDVSPSPALQHFRDRSYLALERYQPRYYPGKIRFVRAAIPTDFPANPAAVWSNLAQEFEVKTVPGDHLGIMTMQFENLATALSGFLRNACSELSLS
jgi:thioesterase domain-containing protein